MGAGGRLVQWGGVLTAIALVVAGWQDAGFIVAVIAGAIALTIWTYAMGFERLVQWELRRHGALRFALITLAFLAGHALIAAILYGIGVFYAWAIS